MSTSKVIENREAVGHILPSDYTERVYAGVLGKIIGVYLGRPIEGMAYRDVLAQLGPVEYFVHQQRNVPLIVTDDDISGTFTFVRALEDYASAGKSITAEQIGQTWLNYIIENKTVLWWGGVGMSTEHTAFCRLKQGVPAPASGSIALNSKVVAEQIGSQIFIDGWALACPGQPDLAADFARKAASVSHDGEAIYAAQVVATMEAQAFVEPDLQKLLDLGVSYIPKDSVIYRMIADLREFHSREPNWQKAMTDVMEAKYGYDKFGGNCHVVPNHGLIILALLYGQDDFQRSLMIANTCGWDTDCNSGNVGCLLGIKNGLKGIDAGPDWRGPIADRLFLPTADGGAAIGDALSQAYRIANMGRALAGLETECPKNGARFHFSLPGSVQGFIPDQISPDSKGAAEIWNRDGALAIRYTRLAPGRTARVSTATFVTPELPKMDGYELIACPSLSPGQKISARVSAVEGPVGVRLFVRYYAQGDLPQITYGPEERLRVADSKQLDWVVPDLTGQPICEVGLELSGQGGTSGLLLLDSLSWSGAPELTLRAEPKGDMWRKQWVEALSQFRSLGSTEGFIAINNEGRGLAIHGTREWAGYSVFATLTPHLASAFGLAARVQGTRRYYALLLSKPNKAKLVKVLHEETVLAEAEFSWDWNEHSHLFGLSVEGDRIVGKIDGKPLFDVHDRSEPLLGGAIALVVDDGYMTSSPVRVSGDSS